MTVYWYDHSSPHFIKGGPRFTSGANDDAEWVAEQVSDYKTDKEIAEKIRMKSRSILAWRLQYDHVHFGVFVVENTRKTKANSTPSNEQYTKFDSHYPQTTDATNFHPVPLAS